MRLSAILLKNSKVILENIELRLLSLGDKESLTNFLRRRMGSNGTPLTSNLQLPESEVALVANYMTDSAFASADKICSFLGIDHNTKSIIGCALGAVTENSIATHSIEADIAQASSKLKSLIDFDRLMWSGAEEFLPLGYDGPYLTADIGLVDPKYRELGLYSKLMQMRLERAYKNFGCKYALGCVNNYKAQRYCEKEGWHVQRWINYKDYYVLGKKVFNFSNEPEQKCAKLMILDIDEWLKKRV